MKRLPKDNSPKRLMQTQHKLWSALALVCVFINSVFALKDGDNLTTGGTVISNRAEATYNDENGGNYSTFSQTVTVVISAIPAITVTPDDNLPSGNISPNERITRLFRICNTGNIEDFFMPARAEITAPAVIRNIYFDADNSATITTGDSPVQIGLSLTPSIAPGGCYGVLFEIETNNITPQSRVNIILTAKSTLPMPGTNNPVSDTGTIINVVDAGVRITAPTDANLPPVKLVENLPHTTAAAGQILNYTIVFRNSGAVAARQVSVVDDLPAELEYVANTFRLNNRTLSDAADTDEGVATARRIELLIPSISPDEITQIQFQARLNGAGVNGVGVVNKANVGAVNAPLVDTSNAVAVINPVGTVYAGNSGGAARISGARITVCADENGTPVNLTANAGFQPNQQNANPFNTDAEGNFSFSLAANQLGAGDNPARYIVNVSAPNYRARMIEVLARPVNENGVFKASLRALDDQPLAVANGFSLISSQVEITNLAALVFNIPMFEISSLEISKSADKQNAEIGDIISYRVQVKNATASMVRDAVVRDTLPESFVYAEGTALVELGGVRQNISPETQGNQLTFRLGELAAGTSATISYRVRVGANAREGEHFNSATVSGRLPNDEQITTKPARVAVRVRGGAFSMQQIIIGRVFEDRNGNGSFDAGERAVSGARIYMNNGQSVVTDSAGQYNIPAVNQGSIVLSLDPVTLPKRYKLMDEDGRKSAQSWTRLLRTPLGGGGLLRQNFAIAAKDAVSAVSEDLKVIAANAEIIKDKTASDKDSKDKAEQKQRVEIAGLKNKIPFNIPPSEQNKNSAPKTIVNGQSSETYTVETTETVLPVLPGKILVLSPQAETVVMTPALGIVARVAKNWKIEAKVNGERVDSSNLGESRIDNRNEVATFSFVGINLRPGENTVQLTAIGETDGERGKTEEFKVWGRGAIERLEIVPSKTQAQTGGGIDPVNVEIRGFDRWGNPAVDGQISIETSAGRLLTKNSTAVLQETDATAARQQMISMENGIAVVELVGDGAADRARLKAIAGKQEASGEIRFTAEMRPTIMVGLAEMSAGRAAPEISSTGDEANYRGRLAFYYRGRIFNTNNLLTLAYDSQKPLNRIAGRDRFGGFDPIDRTYPIFGDSSQRFEDAQSNSKLYARIDRGRSYAMFGDMEADMQELSLAGYSRRLTGVKLYLENNQGNFISLTGARPDTAFARDVIPGGSLSVVRLSHGDILQGSEVVTLEVRDRRNPEIIVKRERFIRSVDYNLDEQTGEIFFLRPISTFDYLLNLVQIVVTYEYRGVGASNYIYTGRASQNFKSLGLRVGASYLNQQQNEIGAFQIGGIDIEKTLPKGGRLNFEAAMSNGRYASDVNVFDFYNNAFSSGLAENPSAQQRNGVAFRVRLEQPLPFFQSRLRADFQRASENFYNPFGATVTPGSQRFQVALEMNPSNKRNFTLGYMNERNQTRNVNNSRATFSFLWSEKWNSKIRTAFGFDHRRYQDDLNDRETNSNMVTASIEYRPTEKLDISVKREQNLGDTDPTYPNQTTFAANYQFNQNTKLFFTQRLASGAITPIGDFTGNGFTSVRSRYETAVGIETKLPRLGALSGRYQIENGVNGMDNFAVIGLENRWNVSKTLNLEVGFERGFLLAGEGSSFNSATFGASWMPNEGFRTSARYELRDRNGLGQLFSIGAAGKIGENWTTLVRGQITRSSFFGSKGSSSNVTAAAAYRPVNSDRFGLLFSYNHREMNQQAISLNNIKQNALRDRSDTLSSDGIYQVSNDLEIYGRFALRLNASGNNTDAYSSALTYLAQIRAQQKLGDNLDFAAEYRTINQLSSRTYRRSFGAELGYWMMPDLRFGVGYNFTRTSELNSVIFGNLRQYRGGFYFTITSKLSNLFDLFGTSEKGLDKEDK